MAIPTETNIIMAHRQEEGEEQIEEDIELDNPEYAMTKENLKKITKEIAASRKKKANQEKGRGSVKLSYQSQKMKKNCWLLLLTS